MKGLYRNFLILTLWRIIAGYYTYWTPDGVKELWCPDSKECFRNMPKDYADHCCSCNAIPQWQLPNSNLSYQSLAIEILDGQEKRSIVFNVSAYAIDSTVFSFTYIYGKLRQFPETACNFKIVSIDVAYNKFSKIGNISCFVNLDTLIMKHNKITFVSNQTFIGMEKLRMVDLSYNFIRNMDLNVLSNNAILYFHFGSNDFQQVDVTNLVAMNKIMCGVSYKNNRQKINITNINGFQLGDGSSKMCNDIDVSGVATSSLLFIEITKNIDSTEFSKYIPCGQHLYKETSFSCDCNVAELMPLSLTELKSLIWKDDDSEYYCGSPTGLFNVSIYDVYNAEGLRDLMICNIEDYCHSKPNCRCKCTSQPSQNRLVVDCSNQLCTDFPDIVPTSKYDVTLIMKNNSIRDIKPKQYFSRVKILDLSENPVQNLHDNIDILEKVSEIRINNHSLQTLPKTVQHLHPDVFRFEKSGLPCICENIWIGEWRRFKMASREYPLYCSNYDTTLIEDKILKCEESNAEPYWSISIVLPLLLLILIVMSLYMYFRFDFCIMRRRFLNLQPHTKWEYDVYISANEENDDVRYFILHFVEPLLHTKNIHTYVPFRDAIPGITREEDVILNLQKCKYVLIIQSKDMYSTTKDSAFVRRLEYNLTWNHFIKGQVDKVLILSFDDTQFDKFHYRKTRAINRAGMGFIVSTRKNCIKKKLLQTFCHPIDIEKTGQT